MSFVFLIIYLIFLPSLRPPQKRMLLQTGCRGLSPAGVLGWNPKVLRFLFVFVVLHGLDIPAILVHYNKCVNEGNVPKSSQDENYRRARRAFLIGYDRSVPKLRQASHCTGCNQCNPHCPQSIDIPKELHRIDAYVEQLKQETL